MEFELDMLSSSNCREPLIIVALAIPFQSDSCCEPNTEIPTFKGHGTQENSKLDSVCTQDHDVSARCLLRPGLTDTDSESPVLLH